MRISILILGGFFLLYGCNSSTPGQNKENPTDNGGDKTGGTQNNGGKGNSGKITPLPKTSFVYLRYYRDGRREIRVYDLKAKTDRTLISFPPPKDSSKKSIQLAISPDRRWLAIKMMKIEKKDVDSGFLVRSLWKLSADGKQLIRLTEPFTINGTKCTSDLECKQKTPATPYCHPLRKQCEKKNFKIYLPGNISWSEDGSKIWFSVAQSWSESDGRIVLGAQVASVSANGGKVSLYGSKLNKECPSIMNPAPRPKNPDQIAVVGYVCSAQDKLFDPNKHQRIMIYNLKTGSSIDAISTKKATGQFTIPLDARVVWDSAGSAFLFLLDTAWDLDGDQKPDVKSPGIALLSLKDAKAVGVVPPSKSEVPLFYSISPDDNQIIYSVIRKNAASPSAIYLLDGKTNRKQLLLQGDRGYLIGPVVWTR